MSGGIGDIFLQMLMQQMQQEEQNPGMSALMHTGRDGPPMPAGSSALWMANTPPEFQGGEYDQFQDPIGMTRGMMTVKRSINENRDPNSNSFRAPDGKAGPTRSAARRNYLPGPNDVRR